MAEIVLAYTPSTNLKDWGCRADGDGNWFYEQYVRFYDTAHNELCAGGYDGCGKRAPGKEPYYDLGTKEVTEPPRIYIDHHPQKGEWEHIKTVDDLKNSPLYDKRRNG